MVVRLTHLRGGSAACSLPSSFSRSRRGGAAWDRRSRDEPPQEAPSPGVSLSLAHSLALPLPLSRSLSPSAAARRGVTIMCHIKKRSRTDALFNYLSPAARGAGARPPVTDHSPSPSSILLTDSARRRRETAETARSPPGLCTYHQPTLPARPTTGSAQQVAPDLIALARPASTPLSAERGASR